MGRIFDDIEIGKQLEQAASRGSIIYGAGKNFDPDAVVAVAIVTDIWYDPVEAKEYVGLAKLRSDGSYGKPTEKRTITGLARSGWRYAKKDWIEFAKVANEAIKSGKVISMWGARTRKKNGRRGH